MISYSESDSKEIGTLSTDMNAYIDRYAVEVVTGERDLEESWEEYLKVLKGMGVERLIEIYQEAYEAAAPKAGLGNTPDR